MKELLKLSQERRRAVFEATAREMHVNPLIVEKDFWVCVVLDYLFNKSKYKDCLLFKGGTSLSKCYGVIKRFSEDVDIILKWDTLGYTDEVVYEERSKNQNNLFEISMNEKGGAFIQNEIKNDLIENLAKTIEGMNVINDEHDPMVLYVEYPHTKTDYYINAFVKLEIGPVSAKTPVEAKSISPYYSNYVVLNDDDISFNVNVVSIARTFWEKLLILYSETNRPADKRMPRRYFRHYYDVVMIYKSDYFDEILKKKDLFEEVRLFKNKYFRNNWSKLETCALPTISIYPPTYRMEDLKTDYSHMKDMFFGEIPTFEEVLHLVKELENILRSL